MHVDLCIELEGDDASPEDLADKVFRFQQDLGPTTAFSAEVTPVDKGLEFTAALTKRMASGNVLWAPDPPKDVIA